MSKVYDILEDLFNLGLEIEEYGNGAIESKKAIQQAKTDLLAEILGCLPEKKACLTHSINDNDFTNDGENYCEECKLNNVWNACLTAVETAVRERMK
jgi:hypothetical protein